MLFVGRITRQKGIIHLVHAIRHLTPGFQVVLCAGAPDTPEIAAEMQAAVAAAQAVRTDVLWIEDMLDKPRQIALYSHADVFCCPSIYEPFGIINLEAMACETPVVASAVGGIKEVVLHGETGILVPLRADARRAPSSRCTRTNSRAIWPTRINKLMADPDLRDRMAKAGRQRAVDKFSWSAIAQQTKTLYESLLAR